MPDIDDRWHTRTGTRTDRYGQGKRWLARWRDDRGQQCKRSFERQADARHFLAKVTTDLASGAYTDHRGGRMPFREYAESWRLAQVHRPTTVCQVETNLRRHAYPTFGDRALASVRPSEIQAWVRGLDRDLQPATIEVVYSFVSSIFRAAVKDRLIPASPCIDIRLPKIEPKRIEPMATEQVEALIHAIPERYRALVILGAGCGLRQGEAFGLTVDRVNWLKRTLTVDRQLIQVKGSQPSLAQLKTPASYRTIPLPTVVTEALASHLARFPAIDGYVFTDGAGLPLKRTRFCEVWRPACRRAGLADAITFHDLRHFFASLLIHHGESVKVVQKRLGHKNASETLDTYAHLWPESEDATRAAVDSVLSFEVAAVAG